ncbi:hypothetical protein R3W88_008342 [Solanum pinnatisectum]|uniref:DUF4283 domain-containing protein n=1 Tax=Solanum pinnatisectum TaxID=50273 RepID=A0AAV9M7R5_9SOLN|nr:hypothetical protein R3W88_008342 [Solanum pinnatisectum]
MHAGPYTYHNKPFVLQNWEASFMFDTECITTIPLWVNFPGLPVGYWSAKCHKLRMNRISYARVLVEVDISQPLVEIVTLDTHHGSFHQDVTYKLRPKFCSDCLKFGHATKDYWAKPYYPLAEEFKEAPKRKRRGRRRHKTIPKWKVRPAIKTDEAPTTYDIANKDQARPSYRAIGDTGTTLTNRFEILGLSR